MDTFTVTVREVAREQKRVFDKVRRTKEAAVVVSRDKGPQVAIVPLETLEKIESQSSIQVLYDLVELGKKYHTKGLKTNGVEDTKTVWD